MWKSALATTTLVWRKRTRTHHLVQTTSASYWNYWNLIPKKFSNQGIFQITESCCVGCSFPTRISAHSTRGSEALLSPGRYWFSAGHPDHPSKPSAQTNIAVFKLGSSLLRLCINLFTPFQHLNEFRKISFHMLTHSSAHQHTQLASSSVCRCLEDIFGFVGRSRFQAVKQV